jgi:hypothetical protein
MFKQLVVSTNNLHCTLDINMTVFHIQVFGSDRNNESLLEVLSFQQGNQRRDHHVAEKGNAGMVSLSLLI